MNKNSGALSRADARVHESIMSPRECVSGLSVRVCTTIIGLTVKIQKRRGLIAYQSAN